MGCLLPFQATSTVWQIPMLPEYRAATGILTGSVTQIRKDSNMTQPRPTRRGKLSLRTDIGTLSKNFML